MVDVEGGGFAAECVIVDAQALDACGESKV
jgi:hypothetical protein